MASFMRQLFSHTWFPFLLAALSCLLLWPAIGAGFQLDDWFQHHRLLGHGEPAINLFVFYDGEAETNRARIENGSLAWWASENLRHANFRYLSTLTMQLDHLLWPDSATMMHLHSLVWLAALVIAVAKLFRATMMPLWLAGLAALLYAVDDAHALPAVYLANRSALIATFFGALSLLYQVKRRHGKSALFLALSLSAAEIGLGTLAYLGAYALCLDKGSMWQRCWRMWPQSLVFLAWATAYTVGGFGSTGSGFYLDPLHSPVEFLAMMGQRFSVLLMGQWTPIPADIAVNASGQNAWMMLTLTVVCMLLIFIGPLIWNDRHARYWAFGSIIAMVPVLAVGPQNRLLLFVGIGAMGLLAQWLHALFARSQCLPSKVLWRYPAYLMALCLLVTHLLLAPLTGFLFLQFQDRSSQNMVSALGSIPNDSFISEQDLILVNPPEYTYLVSAIEPFLVLQGRPRPNRIRALVAGSQAMTVYRLDENTLELSLSQGLFPTQFSRYQRSSLENFIVGQRVELDGFSVEIMALNETGDPTVIRYQFEHSVQNRRLRWLRYHEGQYIGWQPPAIGEIESLEAEAGIFEN